MSSRQSMDGKLLQTHVREHSNEAELEVHGDTGYLVPFSTESNDHPQERILCQRRDIARSSWMSPEGFF